MALKLPRLQLTQPIVDLERRPTTGFQRFWQEAVTAIEGAIAMVVSVNTAQDAILASVQTQQASIQSLLASIQTQQAQLAAQLALINQAQVQASTAGQASAPPTTPQTRSASAYVDLSGTGWIAGPSVSFDAAVSVAAETFEDSGPVTAGVVVGAGDFVGQVRVVRVIGGVDTVVEALGFDVVNEPPPDADTLNFTAFTHNTAQTNTGAIAYRLDARRVSGAAELSGALFKLSIKRTP